MSTSPEIDHLDGQRSPKRRRLDVGDNEASRSTVTVQPNQDNSASRRPSWSPVTNAPTPTQHEEQQLDSPEATNDTFLHEPRPLPQQRLRSVEPSVTPGLESTSIAATPLAEPPEQQGFLENSHAKPKPSQSPSSSTNRSTTPATQDEFQEAASSPVPSHSTIRPDLEPEQQHKDASPVNYKPHLILRGHKRAIAAVKFSPDGKWIASCSSDATARIYSSTTGQPKHTLHGHLAGISTLAWSPDSLTLATGSDDKSIRLWSTTTGTPHSLPLLGHHNYIYSLAFSPAGNMLVSGSYDEAVYLWDVRTARVMRKLPAHSDPVGGVDFVHDGSLVVSCSSDGLIRVWDVATGQCLRTFFHEDTPPVVSVRFSPNGRYIATWMLDDSVRVWNYVEGRCVKTYQGGGYLNAKWSVQGAWGVYGGERSERGGHSEYEEDEKDAKVGGLQQKRAMLASGSEDGSVFLWDVNSKAVLQRLIGHKGVVMGVDVHPTEKLIVSCGTDKTIRLWRDVGERKVNGVKSAS